MESATRRFRRRLTMVGGVVALLAGLLPATLPAVATAATGDPENVSFTLQGCRFTTGLVLPNGGGEFICPDGNYTTGNLGAGWNELDLVPHRITAQAGNSAPATQTYVVAVAGDNCQSFNSASPYDCANGTAGIPGYDDLSAPALNTSLSDSSCTASPSSGSFQVLDPGVGGTQVSLGRKLTITQLKGTTCVYDFYERLALGSALYPGASLHTNLLNQSWGTSGMGAKDVSIPVKGILPQELSKSMTATQGSTIPWSITKSSTPATLTFSDTCSSTNATSQKVTVTVSWTKLAATASGDVTIQTIITATNPANRSMEATINDTIYDGSTQSTVTTAKTGSNPMAAQTVSIPANSSQQFTHTITTASTAGAFNDVATGTYTDTVTTVPIPGHTTATASATVQSTTPAQNATAVITDTESLTGDSNLEFSVDSTTGATGNFTSYTLGAKTNGPLVWTSSTQSGSSSVTFNKTVYVKQADSGTGSLADTASLLGSNGFAPADAKASTSITTDAAVKVTVDKTMPVDVTGAQTFNFDVYSGSDTSGTKAGSIAITIDPATASKNSGGTLYLGSGSLTGLEPGTYTIHEVLGTGSPWAQQADQTVTITLPTCSGSKTVNNTFTGAGAQVQKVTVPAGGESGWSFLLVGPNTPTTSVVCGGQTFAGGGECATTTGTSAVKFTTPLVQGSYTVTEVGQTGWKQSGLTLDGTAQAGSTCSFSVAYPTDANHTFSCVFTNTELAKAKVVKTTNPTGSESGWQFTLYNTTGGGNTQVEQETTNSSGIATFTTPLDAGSYSIVETAKAGWDQTVPGSGAACTFTVAFPGDAGATKTCNFTNQERSAIKVVKTESGAALTGTDTFNFILCSGSSALTSVCSGAMTQTATAANGGTIYFGLNADGTGTPTLKAGSYQLCERIPAAGWQTSLSSLPGAYTFTDGGSGNVYECAGFTLGAGVFSPPLTFNVDNTPPPGGLALTIGYWKTHGCVQYGNNPDKVSDLLAANNIMLGSYRVTSCTVAYNVLSNPSGKYAENQLAAQLLAAELNRAAGAGNVCSIDSTIAQANTLLTGVGYNPANAPTQLIGPQSSKRSTATSLAGRLDSYNNNTLTC